VHVSVSRPDEGSTLPYFRGKAEVERAVRESGLLFGIVRPTLVFGADDILVNNIAWVLRRFPFFVLAGRGDYRVQPVSVADVARLCVDVRDNSTIDAAGPETFTFEELVRLVAAAVGSGARILHTSPRVMLGFGLVVGRVLGDVVLTPEELRGLMLSLLTSDAPPTGRDGFREWVAANADRLGRAYASELRRNYRHAPL
jgi:NADH dehydrogenase